MIYTILGGITGAIVSFVLCRLFRVSEISVSFFPSPASICIYMGTLIGFGAGFGYGSGQLLAGTHLYQNLIK